MGTRGEWPVSTTSLIVCAERVPRPIAGSVARGISRRNADRRRIGITTSYRGRFFWPGSLAVCCSLYPLARPGARRLHRRQESVRSYIRRMVVYRSVASCAGQSNSMATTPQSSSPLGYTVVSMFLLATAYAWRETRLAYA